MIEKVFSIILVIFLCVITYDLVRIQGKDSKCIQLGGTPSKGGTCVKVISREVK